MKDKKQVNTDIKVFWCSNFVKNAAEVKGEEPLSLSADSETLLRNTHARGEEGEKSESFSRESEQDRSPFLTAREQKTLENVPVEHFQRDKIAAPKNFSA